MILYFNNDNSRPIEVASYSRNISPTGQSIALTFDSACSTTDICLYTTVTTSITWMPTDKSTIPSTSEHIPSLEDSPRVTPMRTSVNRKTPTTSSSTRI